MDISRKRRIATLLFVLFGILALYGLRRIQADVYTGSIGAASAALFLGGGALAIIAATAMVLYRSEDKKDSRISAELSAYAAMAGKSLDDKKRPPENN